MHDLKWIRENPEEFDAALKRRGIEPDGRIGSTHLVNYDSTRRETQGALQELQERRNEISREIGVLKGKGDDAQHLMEEVSKMKSEMQDLEEQGRQYEEEIEEILSGIPNILADDVPDGPDETANQEIRREGAPPAFDFKVKDHTDLGAALGLMDFEAAARISGARFVVLKGALARMERALAAFMLDIHCDEFGYTEHYVPQLVRDEAAYGTGQLPKFSEDLFKTTTGLWLVPTAEVPLTNMVAGEILEADNLPMRLTAYTSCFRSEAGAAGKDTKGMIRQHQFGKVELVSITTAEDSQAEHERMTGCAEEILKRLGLSYRVMVLCSGDTGFGAAKTYDIEVWMPSQDTYREISSCSNCRDFQARRMKARYKEQGGKGTRFVHTLNGSGMAVGRTMIAIIENFQNADGSITIPAALRPYMGGCTTISTDG